VVAGATTEDVTGADTDATETGAATEWATGAA
jgi:hypothetical protein